MKRVQSRGEFSIIIAGLGVVIEPRLGALAAAYVLLLAVAGPLCARFAPAVAAKIPLKPTTNSG